MMASSSDSDTPSFVGSRRYRYDDLRDCQIYIDTLVQKQWPDEVIKLAHFLTNDNFRHTIKESQVESLTGPNLTDSIPAHARIADDDANTTSVAGGCSLALSETLRLRPKLEPLLQGDYAKNWWVELAQHMFSTLNDDKEIATSYKDRWDQLVQSWERLTKARGDLWHPKPDLAYGLSPSDRRGVLRESTLKRLAPQLDSLPWMYDHDPIVVYPAVIYEGQAEHGNLFIAENKAAVAAAKALMMQRDLALSADRPEAHISPVAVFCSQGALWEVYIAIDHAGEADDSGSETTIEASPVPSGVHLLSIWSGRMSRIWDMFQLQVIIQRSLIYLKRQHKPAIKELLEKVQEIALNEL